MCRETCPRLKEHLSRTHNVANPREMQLLVALSKGTKVGKTTDCPVPDCGLVGSARLDRHLLRVHRCTLEQQRQHLIKAHRTQALRELGRLRETCPDPPMVSQLDSLSVTGPETNHLEQIQPALDSFRGAFLGPRPSQRRRDNAQQKAARVKRFFDHCRDKGGPDFVNALALAEEVTAWPTQLLDRGLAVTTLRHYLMDLSAFADHALHCPQRPCCLREADLRAISRRCSAQIKIMRADLIVHRTDAREKMSRAIVGRGLLCAYMRRARRRIPRVLERLQPSSPYRRVQEAQGLIAGYLAIISGHRRGVLANMTAMEVTKAHELRGGYRVISVRDHKTASFFGRAKIALSPQEYAWLGDLMRRRGIQSDLVFCSPQGALCRGLLTQFRAAWRSLGFVGKVTFGSLRSSLVTHVSSSPDGHSFLSFTP